MNLMQKTAMAVGVIASFTMTTTAFAAPAEAPNAFVKRVADQLTTRLKTDAPKLKNNPALVRQVVQQNIEPHVDTQGFARLVMGNYASNTYSTAAQRAQFERSFKDKLINNYGAELAKYANNSYTMRPYKENAANKTYPVVMIDFLHQGQKIPVAFQLTEKNNQWKIRNIDVEGVNIGFTLRSQFADTVTKNGNNIDKAIANFNPDLDKAKKK